ncbi:S8 family serine peptidase [Microcoleus sp. herbarium12]|uniref:S8 family serine peptidase n=1 Tax=Microcoleus sp. herbarium12 TaxID=3055437 RepID=UPI002FCFB712
MESTGILGSDRQQQLTAPLTTFGNSGQFDFLTAPSQFSGSVPSNGFDADRLTASAIGEPQQIADFLVPKASDSLSFSTNNQVASATSAPISNSDALAGDTDPLTGTRTASQLNLSYPDNTLATARNVVGVENGRVNLSDFVGVGDSDDFYRFTLNSNSDLTLRLDGLRADADLQIIQDNNRNGIFEWDEVIGKSFNYDSTPENINLLGLNPGTYYVRVYNFFQESTNYNLTIAATTSVTGFNNIYGYGLVDANAAVSRALNSPNSFPAVPNLGGNNWGRDTIDAPEIWERGITGNGIVVAVVDGGVDYTHPDLDGNIWRNPGEIPNNNIDDDRNGFIDDIGGWDFVSNDNNPMDESLSGHGTHVAGIIAAERNDFGITGVAYNAKIMPVRVLPKFATGSWSDVAAGIRYAVDNGANIINLSLGSDTRPQPLVDAAIQYATDKKVVVVMSAGNESSPQPDYPAINATRFGIAVGGIDKNNRMYKSSDLAGFRPLDYLVAPGVDIYSTTPNNTYKTFNGTSMAAPHVAGVAALVLNANPTLTPAQVEYILTTTANRNGITV